MPVPISAKAELFREGRRRTAGATNIQKQDLLRETFCLPLFNVLASWNNRRDVVRIASSLIGFPRGVRPLSDIMVRRGNRRLVPTGDMLAHS